MLAEHVKSEAKGEAAVLMLARGSSFPEQLIEKALKIARNSHSILVALNVCPGNEHMTNKKKRGVLNKFEADCHWNALHLKQAADLLNVRLDHLVLLGSSTDCVKKARSKYPLMNCVLAEAIRGDANA